MAKAFDSVDREILFSHFRNKAQKGLTAIQIIKNYEVKYWLKRH